MKVGAVELTSFYNAIDKKEKKGPANGNAKTGPIETGDLAIAKVLISPPTIAPEIPIRMVMNIPPGSFPGMMIFARTPAMRPNTIQEMMPNEDPPCESG